MSAEGETSADRNVEMWKIKKLIKSLEAARGYGPVWLTVKGLSQYCTGKAFLFAETAQA